MRVSELITKQVRAYYDLGGTVAEKAAPQLGTNDFLTLQAGEIPKTPEGIPNLRALRLVAEGAAGTQLGVQLDLQRQSLENALRGVSAALATQLKRKVPFRDGVLQTDKLGVAIQRGSLSADEAAIALTAYFTERLKAGRYDEAHDLLVGAGHLFAVDKDIARAAAIAGSKHPVQHANTPSALKALHNAGIFTDAEHASALKRAYLETLASLPAGPIASTLKTREARLASFAHQGVVCTGDEKLAAQQAAGRKAATWQTGLGVDDLRARLDFIKAAQLETNDMIAALVDGAAYFATAGDKASYETLTASIEALVPADHVYPAEKRVRISGVTVRNVIETLTRTTDIDAPDYRAYVNDFVAKLPPVTTALKLVNALASYVNDNELQAKDGALYHPLFAVALTNAVAATIGAPVTLRSGNGFAVLRVAYGDSLF